MNNVDLYGALQLWLFLEELLCNFLSENVFRVCSDMNVPSSELLQSIYKYKTLYVKWHLV